MVRAQLDIGMDVVSNGQVAAAGSYNVYEAIDGFESKPVELAEGESFLSPTRDSLAPARHAAVSGLLLQHVRAHVGRVATDCGRACA